MSNKSTVLLEHHLKELKLPTFLRENDKLTGQCAAEGADHPDYLLRLSELELLQVVLKQYRGLVAHDRLPTRRVM